MEAGGLLSVHARYLNADIPHFYCLLRREYVYDLHAYRSEFEPCVCSALPPSPAGLSASSS